MLRVVGCQPIEFSTAVQPWRASDIAVIIIAAVSIVGTDVRNMFNTLAASI
jgi:hypothetical protein